MARGSITHRTNKDGGRSYVVRWDEPRDSAGKRRQREQSFPRKREAEDFRVKTQHDLRAGSYVRPSALRLGPWLRAWVEGRVDVKPTTVNEYRRAAGLWADLDAVPLSEITTARVEAAQRALLDRGLAVSTVNRARAVLHRALRDAVRDRLIATNPVSAVSRPRPAPVVVIAPWSSAEATAFLASEPPLLWRVLLLLMLRPGEAIALRWDDLDETHATLTVRRTLTRDRDGAISEGTPKGGRERSLPLDANLLSRLRAHRNEQAARLGDRWSDTTPIFDRGDGARLHPSKVSGRFALACAAMGVRPIRPHDLRHTGATLLAEAGVNPRDLQLLLGHADVRTTLALYVHPTEDSRRAAAARLAALLG